MYGSRRRNINRLAQISKLAIKHGFGYYIKKYDLPLPYLKKEKKYLQSSSQKIKAKRLRRFLQECGPTFVKIGQLLSVRPDLLPPEFIFELEKLQDMVPSFDYALVEMVFQEEFGVQIEDVFLKFKKIPIASASIGQVHVAWLKDGTKVAVKIQRPEAEKIIKTDLDLILNLLERVKEKIHFIDIVGFTKEFSKSLHRELDYRIEAEQMRRFREQFKDDSRIKIPIVFSKHTGKRVLTMEFIEGTKIDDLATPEIKGIDMYELAIYGAKVFMKQVLEDGYFHGDLHPSNILITPEGKIAYIDFGIVGEIKDEDKEIITSMLSGIVRQNMETIVNEAEKLGVKFPKDKMDALKEDLKKIVNNYYGRTLGDLKIDIIGREFLSLIFKYRIVIPKDYA
ncbi:MAG: AarF/ABC1/UbiB kinase family protein, partial [Actinomycetia bacterium]|nr:AarF/ABC1/UbiB kinase family protein [Actinomycetes bacterium]